MICQPELSHCASLTTQPARITAVGRSTMPARQCGTRCQMNLEIPTVLTVLNGS